MFESGYVTVDQMIKRGNRGVQEKGPQFKVEDKRRQQLFLGDSASTAFNYLLVFQNVSMNC